MTFDNTNMNIPSTVDEDEPFAPPAHDDEMRRLNPNGRQIDPEKEHSWQVEDFKNSSAQLIVIVCLLCIALFAIIPFLWTGADKGAALANASDVFKLIATNRTRIPIWQELEMIGLIFLEGR